ncbi:hypothetical protein ACF1BQ_038320 [Bradyrhizobium sp. RDT10]
MAKLPAWIWFIFPAAYVLADFVEDSENAGSPVTMPHQLPGTPELFIR